MNDYKLYQAVWPYQFVWLKKLVLCNDSYQIHATQQSPPRAKVPKAADKAKMQSAAHPTEQGEVEQALYLLK